MSDILNLNTYDNYVLSLGPAVYYPLTERAGNNRANDLVTGANHLDNAYTADPGSAGPGQTSLVRSTHFTRANSDQANILDNDTVSTGDIDFTLCGWANKDSSPAGEMFIISKDGGIANTSEFGLLWSNVENRWRFYITNQARAVFNVIDANTLGVPSNATWYFIAAWVDRTAATVNIQINDGAIDSIAKTVTMFNGTARFGIGGRQITAGSDNFFDGSVAGVSLSKRILSSNERTKLYQLGLA